MSLGPATVPSPNGKMSDAEVRAAARDAYRAALADGQPITGAELGRRFGLSDRWGRARVAEVRHEANANGHRPANPDRHQPPQDTDSQDRDSPSDPPGATPPRRTTPSAARGQRTRRPTARDDRDREPGRSWLDSAITLTVALVAAAASYGHMFHVALLAGEPLWIARAWPITVDGLVLAALRRGEHGRAWLALGAAVSVAANVLAQYAELATTAGPVISAWPPIALYGTHRLLQGRRRSSTASGRPSRDDRETAASGLAGL